MGAGVADAQVVISQIYGGGGNSGAPFTNDFIELNNRGCTTVNMAGWSVQYASASGTSWTVTPLSGPAVMIPPGGYFLVQEGSGGAVGSALPTADSTGTINMSATAGKVALVNSTTALTGACPGAVSIQDFIGYGAANCAEGSFLAPAPSNTTADIRKYDGCQDTNVNGGDFSTGTPIPRNSGSLQSQCGACCLGDACCEIRGKLSCITAGGCFQGCGVSCNTAPANTAMTYNATIPTPLAIPDNNAAGMSSSIVVTDNYCIGNVKVQLLIAHTWQGDLRAVLQAPDGTLVVLVNRPGVPLVSSTGFDTDNLGNPGSATPFVLSDAASGPYQNPPVTVGIANPTGPYKPDFGPAFSSLNGKKANGTWRLFVFDLVAADTGTLIAWSLVIDKQDANQLNCPQIVTQPGNQTVCAGGTATYTLGAIGNSLQYQWRCGFTPLVNGPSGNGSTISGATSATLTISNVQAADAACSYNCIVQSDSLSVCTEISDSGSLTVNALPSCSISGPGSVCGNSTDTYMGPAGMASYQWSISAGSASINGNSTDQSVSVSAPSNGSYTLSLIVNDETCPATCQTVVLVNSGPDADGDGISDACDGCPNDPNKVSPGLCGCGVSDTDTDGDGTPDCFDGCPNDPLKIAPGVCGCGVADTDTDGDGTPDCNDGCPTDPNKTSPGVCGCGTPDTDTDGDGTPDCNDGCPSDPNKLAPGLCG